MALASLVSIAACGSRGPLDVEIVEVQADAGSTADVAPPIDAEPEAAADAPADVAADTSTHDATLIDCASCVAQQCGTYFVQCLQDTACRATLQCAAQKCFAGGGGANPQCLLQCATDPKGAVGVLHIITCVTNQCGSDCTSVLGGLGGLGGGGGGTRDGG